MLGLQDLKIERLVLDLVASEVLRRDRRAQKQEEAGDRHTGNAVNSGFHDQGRAIRAPSDVAA
jgi:hypothetical protein